MEPKHIGIKNGIVKAVSLVTIIIIISKILGLLREVGIASYFGVGAETDAFYAAVIIPALLFTSVGVALQKLFMIEFSKYKALHPDRKDQSVLSSNVVHIVLSVSILIFVLSFIFAPFIVKVIAPGFHDGEKFNLTIKLTRILLPTMVIIPVYQIKSSVLRVYNKFVSISIIDLGFNLFQLIYLFLFANRFGIEGLAYSILFAYVFQLIVIEIVSLKMGFRFKKVYDLKDPHWRNMIRLFIPTFISFGIIQVNALVDKIIASNLGDGSISALNYGFMVRNVVYSIGIATVLMVIYPALLKYKAEAKQKKFNEIAFKTFHFLLLLSIPLSLLLIVFDESVIRILFQRGEFTGNDTIITSGVMLFYSIGIAFFAIREFLIHVSYANQDSKTPLYVTLFGSILNIILSLLLKESMGVYGIALGLSLSEFLSFILIIFLINRKKYLDFDKQISDTVKIVGINIILGVLLFVVKPYLNLPSTFALEVLWLAIYGIIILLIYMFLAYISRLNLFKDFKILIHGDRDEII